MYTLARAWVVNGGHVLIISRTEKTLSKVCQDLNECGPGKAEYVVGDLSSKAGCLAACAEVKKKFQKIHVLVNNAGTILTAPFDDVPEKGDVDSTTLERKIGVLHDIRAHTGAGKRCKQHRQVESHLIKLTCIGTKTIDPGRVIVMSSAAALHYNAETLRKFDISGKGNWSYKASKASAMNLSTTLAVTLGPKFITVNAICPGFYPSEMTQPLYATIGDSIDKEHPMGRSGTPEDIAGVFLFLTSRAGAHVSANHILSDGGAIAAGKFT
ncbi:hypothetical protein PSHT_14466 [Puccinia striiformis]|uniref:NAD(P)-binding protein n=2 Tax=Puccinia striiformis TaxID=27350 RepID=A0A2S4W3D6_9BASI|nr:hypothetical protein PSHT_14466 [Puccinia striiformis]POW16270.1 hypothetical protein PSTT_01411 [Puccinia striiformis]